jgi:hypothetical protein
MLASQPGAANQANWDRLIEQPATVADLDRNAAMLPSDEASRIVLLISDAFTYASEGRIPRGYLMLRDGLQDARQCPDPWAGEAEKVLTSAIDRFKERFPADWYPEA